MPKLGLGGRPAGFGWTTLALAAALVITAACVPDQQNLLKDGFYTAEATDFDVQGWKEYLTIYICDGRIVSAEFDSRNSRGFLRSWDMADKRLSNLRTGTNLNKYSRVYTVALLNRQDPEKVNAVPGAALAHQNFQSLAKAAIDQARAGNQRVAFVHLKDRP
jgi:major membrane immunogen (membrane-anchored lipoprotein)